MERALTLACGGVGFVAPNPLVGCVIVKNNTVIAQGFHKKYGGAHAEVVAMNHLKAEHRKKLRGATVYVNLEPCSHVGKTPPCADALIAAGVARVVVGMKDPNPLVAGKGIRKLRAAGIEVMVGMCEKEAQELNEIFCNWITKKETFVMLKCAVTLDGALTMKKGTRSDFSCPESYEYMHELRQQYDAIAVGIETVLIDNPKLTTRRKKGISRNPVRVIFDTHLRTPERAQLFQESGRTIIFTGKKIDETKRHRLEKLGTVEIVTVGINKKGHVQLSECIRELGTRGITSVMVEGGRLIARELLERDLVDKLLLTVTPHMVTDPAAPRLFLPPFPLSVGHIEWTERGQDTWLSAYPKKV